MVDGTGREERKNNVGNRPRWSSIETQLRTRDNVGLDSLSLLFLP